MKTSDTNMKTTARRKLLKALAASGTAAATTYALPGEWGKPVVEFILLPAHAQTSSLPNQILQFLFNVNAAAAPVAGAQVMCITVMMGGELQNARALVSSGK